jgi:hypothetical protein
VTIIPSVKIYPVINILNNLLDITLKPYERGITGIFPKLIHAVPKGGVFTED